MCSKGFETLWISCSATSNWMDIRYSDDGGFSNSVLFSTWFRRHSSLKKSSSFSKKKGNYNKLKIIFGLSLWAHRFLFSTQSNPSLQAHSFQGSQSRICSVGTTSSYLLCADISPSLSTDLLSVTYYFAIMNNAEIITLYMCVLQNKFFCSRPSINHFSKNHTPFNMDSA